MADPGQSRETPRIPWRRLHKLIARRLDGLRKLLSRRGETEVFPWMEHAAVIAAILGAILAIGLGRTCHLGTSGLIFGGFLGAIASGLGGIWLALSWAVEAPGRGAGPTAGRDDLWDRWLDEHQRVAGDDPQPPPPIEEAVVELAGEIVEERVRVRPRVRSSESGESLPLEDEIGPILASHDRGAIEVSGPAGAGKTTALTHLARRVPPHFQVSFLDEPDPLALAEAAARGLVVFASSLPGPKLLADMRLAPWGKDEWIEYLLAGDRRLCASVMARLAQQEAEQGLLEGIPELWRIVLDRMAADESIRGPRQALRIELDRRLADRESRERIQGDCLAALVIRGRSSDRLVECLRRHDPDESLVRLIRHRAIQLLLAADRIADDLTQGRDCEALAILLPRDLVREAALRIAKRPEAVDRLRRLIADRDETRHPMVASLLHALGVGWKPDRPPPCLSGAYLEDASWDAVELSGADMGHVDLSGAVLWGARFDRARLENAHLADTDLRTASLLGARLDGADLSRARLAGVRANGAHLRSAHLNAADLEAARLDRAILRNADLTDARLVGASLVGADLASARLDGTEFSRADLSGAVMPRLRLSGARFENARFTGANLSHCDLEGMVLPGAAFAEVDLSHALLTGSRMPGADFRGARLRAAGLAEVDWERADLRGADLREAAFHLGSSRSGLVGSPIACEGSRTGFYTDDYDEQDFKSPEEIRKANLLGVDLRGARIDGVDFYLVDLRGALVDPVHVSHLRRCGAILESRA